MFKNLTILSVLLLFTGCVSTTVQKVNYSNYKNKIKNKIPKFVSTQKSIQKVKNLTTSIKRFDHNRKKMINTQKWHNWKHSKYNFITKEKNIKGIKQNFGVIYNKKYKTDEFNMGISYNIKNNSKLILPYNIKRIRFLENWQGDIALLEGKTTIMVVKAKKIIKKRFETKKGKMFGVVNDEVFVSIINKKTQKPINPNTFFKG